MARSEESALDREAGEPLRRCVLLAGIYTVMAAGCAAAIPFAYTLDQGNAIATEARVTGFEKLGGEERLLLLTEFVDAQGRRRTTRDSASMMPGARVGDVVPVIYSPDDERFARVVNSGERWMRGMFQVMAAALFALSLLLVLGGLRRRARNRELLRNGRVERGQAVRIETRRLLANMPPQWRVRASWLDPASAQWREVTSGWQGSNDWAPPAKDRPVLIYVDPANPNRAWLPVAKLREPIANAPATR